LMGVSSSQKYTGRTKDRDVIKYVWASIILALGSTITSWLAIS